MRKSLFRIIPAPSVSVHIVSKIRDISQGSYTAPVDNLRGIDNEKVEKYVSEQ